MAFGYGVARIFMGIKPLKYLANESYSFCYIFVGISIPFHKNFKEFFISIQIVNEYKS